MSLYRTDTRDKVSVGCFGCGMLVHITVIVLVVWAVIHFVMKWW